MIAFNWSIHVIIGFLFSMEFASQPVDTLFIVVGSVLPDIDHRRSVIGRMNLFAGWMSHRGFCHTIAGCLVLALPFLWIDRAAPFVFLGAISHLFGDSLQSANSHKAFKIKWW